MGSVIENAKTKEKCQIFTPDDIVETMLDHVGYIDSLYGKTILENSCGNGQFLKGIVKRYINDCKRKGLSRTKIKNGLGRDIFGIELDPSLYRECIQTLNSITDSFGLKRVCWQIKQADALREPYSLTFDFVVGNPPYVSYWDLEKSEREYIEGKYTTCQYGAWDYSYAFLQDGFNHLNSAGKMAYIIPNSIFKTKSGRSIRTLLQPYLTEVLDFTTTNVFEKVLTSPAIITIIDYKLSSQKAVSYSGVSLAKELCLRLYGFPIFVLTTYKDDLFDHELFDSYLVFDFARYIAENEERVELNSKLIEQIKKHRAEMENWKEELESLLPRAGESATVDERILELDSKIERSIDGRAAISVPIKQGFVAEKINELISKIDQIIESE